MKASKRQRIAALKPKRCPHGCERHMCEDGIWRYLDENEEKNAER